MTNYIFILIFYKQLLLNSRTVQTQDHRSVGGSVHRLQAGRELHTHQDQHQSGNQLQRPAGDRGSGAAGTLGLGGDSSKGYEREAGANLPAADRDHSQPPAGTRHAPETSESLLSSGHQDRDHC